MTTLLLDDLSSSERSNVIDLASRKPVDKLPAERASERVAAQIRSKVNASVLAQACARAARAVSVLHLSVDDAVSMATAWALDHTDPFPPRAA